PEGPPASALHDAAPVHSSPAGAAACGPTGQARQPRRNTEPPLRKALGRSRLLSGKDRADDVGCLIAGLLAERWSPRSAMPQALRRSRRSLPVLKKGTNFSATDTLAPVRGLRPCRGARCLTVKAPKPLSSTLSPRASASTISLKTTLTIRSMSR